MIKILHHSRLFWRRDTRGAAIVEFALIFPILVAMILGSYDLGRGLTINQKVISASQIIGDLITRNPALDYEALQDIIVAGEMALDPYDPTPMGYDIVSIEFDEDDDPAEVWRVTDNMEENEDVFEDAIGLGEEGEGVVAVSVAYTYTPSFTNFIQDEIIMREVAFLRGRRVSVIECEDC